MKKTVQSTIIISCILLFGWNHSKAQDVIGSNIFDYCTGKVEQSSYKTISHDLFNVEIPSDWKADHELKQGISISSTAFADSYQRGFTLSVVPFKDFYFKKNNLIEYYQYQEGTYKGFKAIHLIRNDLKERESDNTVFWRTEFKILNKKEDTLYILVLGKRATATEEPDWCEFQKMIETLEIKE